jgi:hypothetical protein
MLIPIRTETGPIFTDSPPKKNSPEYKWLETTAIVAVVPFDKEMCAIYLHGNPTAITCNLSANHVAALMFRPEKPVFEVEPIMTLQVPKTRGLGKLKV